MRARLLYADRDLEADEVPLPRAEALVQDLDLATLFDAMGGGDDYLRDRAEATLLHPLREPEEILYRQEILADCLHAPGLVRELYGLAVEAVEAKQKARFFFFRETPETQLHKSLTMLDALLDVLHRLRHLADRSEGAFRSRGLRTLVGTLQRELDDDYLAAVAVQLRELRFKRGTLISARLGRGNRGVDFVLRRPRRRSVVSRLAPGGPKAYSFTIPPRDDNGLQMVAELRGRGIAPASSAVAQAADHVLSFFAGLRAELGFYVACVNLHERLAAKGEPTSFPAPRPAGELAFTARGLYDAALTLHVEDPLVGNDLAGDACPLVLITGANQGGKSTFLRSVGIAQLLLQAGMYVPAEELTASIAAGVYTHFSREEDPSMQHGKLDEELSRMSEIVESVEPASMLLCNESFASTNEREGSEIARGVIGAMAAAGVRVLFVTHLYDLGASLRREPPGRTLFLRAEREDDGRRTFRIVAGEPLPTSFAADSYRRILGRVESAT